MPARGRCCKNKGPGEVGTGAGLLSTKQGAARSGVCDVERGGRGAAAPKGRSLWRREAVIGGSGTAKPKVERSRARPLLGRSWTQQNQATLVGGYSEDPKTSLGRGGGVETQSSEERGVPGSRSSTLSVTPTGRRRGGTSVGRGGRLSGGETVGGPAASCQVRHR